MKKKVFIAKREKIEPGALIQYTDDVGCTHDGLVNEVNGSKARIYLVHSPVMYFDVNISSLKRIVEVEYVKKGKKKC